MILSLTGIFFKLKRISRALIVNNKRVDISLSDVLTIAEKYTIKNAERMFLKPKAIDVQLPLNSINSIEKDFHYLIK